MISKRPHPKVPPTKANFEKDFRDKLKLDAEFEKFKKRLVNAAKSSPAVEELLIPLRKLEKAVLIGAHGRRFVFNDKKRRS